MIPLSDDNSLRKTVPLVTYALIIMNILVFLIELAGGEDFIMKWSFVPSHFIAHPASNIPTLFTSMFMHSGWMHLGGNMLYLWIFGDNVEDRFGKIKFIIFYLVCGLAATFSQLAVNSTSSLPNLGASGAIAGVLGAYILLFPQAQINVFFGRGITQMPALIVIGFWFLLQFISNFTSSSESTEGGETGGVAYMAHIGGFLTGLVLAYFLRATEKTRP